MSIIAKFHVSTITIQHLDGAMVKLSAVTRGDRNATWSQASPSGDIEIHCSEEELQFWLGARNEARVIQAQQKERVAKLTEETGVPHHAPHVGVEVLVTMSRSATPGSITRLLNMDSMTDPNPSYPGQYRFEFTSINGGGYTKKGIYISNPAASKVFADAFEHGQREWYMAISPSTDGYPGDGHEFRESVYPAGIWGHGLCGVCFGKPEEH